MIGSDILEGLIFNLKLKTLCEEPKFDVKDVKSDLLQRYYFRPAKQYLLFISQSFSFNYPMETLGGHEIKLIEFINSENLLLFEM